MTYSRIMHDMEAQQVAVDAVRARFKQWTFRQAINEIACLLEAFYETDEAAYQARDTTGKPFPTFAQWLRDTGWKT